MSDDQKISVSRVVLYRNGVDPFATNVHGDNGVEVPAIVTKVHDADEGIVNLMVMKDGLGAVPYVATYVWHDETGTRGELAHSWRWPPRL